MPPEPNGNGTILTVRGLKTWFPAGGGLLRPRRFVRAVDGVDLAVRAGGTLGLVGESGSGKTTVGRTILNLVPAREGSVVFDGMNVLSLTRQEMKQFRRRVALIFQDPFGSLNPRMTVGDIVSEPLSVHRVVPRRERRARVGDLLEKVGLSAGYAGRYPHEFSGGQRQRIGIARALASQPDFVICDEPVSALDVSIQAQILNLMRDLQDEMGLSYLFIAHDLAVVEHFADRVAVMYLGKIVEVADRDALYARPTHPYTESLLSAVPKLNPEARKDRIRLPGEIPSPMSPPTGCPFHTRCPLTRRLAGDLPSGQTASIISAGAQTRITKRCMCEVPELRPTPDDPHHMHSCLMR
jgi:oligopeptide/dipeptide ABC transporter ATP-binding protein